MGQLCSSFELRVRRAGVAVLLGCFGNEGIREGNTIFRILYPTAIELARSYFFMILVNSGIRLSLASLFSALLRQFKGSQFSMFTTKGT